MPLDSAQYQHALQATQSCDSCHENNRVDAFKASMAGDCQECHSSGENISAVRVAEKKFVDPYADKIVVAPPPGVTAGMSVPMYYTKTRIGKDTNPMAQIPAGTFTMGSNTRLSDEGPQHKVKLMAYWIDKYEVTNLQYQQFIEATGRHSPKHFENRTFPKGKIDHPVTYVSWHDAKAYCEWAGKRLPSDAEWEKAARGTDGRTYPWGDEFELNNANTPVRWQSLNMEGDTTPVGAFPGGVSPYGFHDMSGNVWEWTDSWYTQYPGNKHSSENYGELYKTLKGGSWWDCSFYQCGISAPVYNRSFFDPQVKNSSFGIRCAKSK